MRNDDVFKLFFELVESIREKIDTEEASLPRKRKAPRRLEAREGESYHSATIESIIVKNAMKLLRVSNYWD